MRARDNQDATGGQPAPATLTPRQVADELHLALSTVVLYLRHGTIPGGFQVVTRGRWLVDEEIYRRWRGELTRERDPYRIEPRSSRSRAAQSRRSTP